MFSLLLIAFLQLQSVHCEETITTELFRGERLQGQCSAFCNEKYGTQLETKSTEHSPNSFIIWACNGTNTCLDCNMACAEVFINKQICFSKCGGKSTCIEACTYHEGLFRQDYNLEEISKQLQYDNPPDILEDPNKRNESTVKIKWEASHNDDSTAVVFVILMFNHTSEEVTSGDQFTPGLFMGYTSDYNYTIHPLSPKNCYHFRVISVTKNKILGSSNHNGFITYTTDPPILTHNLTNTSVTITWESRPCEMDFVYEIYIVAQPIIGSVYDQSSPILDTPPMVQPRSSNKDTYAHVTGMVPNMKYGLTIKRKKEDMIREYFSYTKTFQTLPSPPNTTLAIKSISPTEHSLKLVYKVEVRKYLWNMDPKYYIVKYWPATRRSDAVQHNISAVSTFYAINNLAAHTNYCISMAIGTEAGLGFYSKAYCNRTKAKGASAPSALEVVELTSTSAVVKIYSPELKNGQLKQYDITYICGSSSRKKVAVPVGDGVMTEALLPNLTPITKCIVEVAAMNTEGHEGEEARTSFTTLEDVPIAAPPVTSCVVTSNKTSSNTTVTWQDVPKSHRRGVVTHYILSVEHVRLHKEGAEVVAKSNETFADSNLNQTIVMCNSTPSLQFDNQEQVLARLAIKTAVGMGPWGKPFQCDIEPRSLSMTTGFITLIIGISVAMGVLVVALLMFFYFFRFKSYKKTPYEEVSNILKYKLFNDVQPCQHCSHKEDPKEWDVFICYIHEDIDFVTELKDSFLMEDIRVFFAKDELSWGCSLNGVIREGLRNSKYGIVVLSQKFFDKCSKWADEEVNALFTKKRLTKEDLILPVWLDINIDDVARYDLNLCDIQALKKDSMSCGDMALELKKKLKAVETCWGCKSCNVSQSWSTSDFSIDNSPVDSLHTTLL